MQRSHAIGRRDDQSLEASAPRNQRLAVGATPPDIRRRRLN
ncbi:hypothetical protein EYF80_065917 [Liparis tanakae]|uniref:Uncharacterized protein n=1 Tax=Liparis tanakae TaxID=230148 RepID=A0A4Z2E5B5_9TELE|nr:hypothetical protein EYF80_065917 [Liparis tanakae]